MITRLRQRAHENRYEIERALAPHVDERWAESFLLELRLQGVGGDDIGQALAEVDSHVAESGTPADVAFGDPAAYARSLELPQSEQQAGRSVLQMLLPNAVSFAGMMLAITSAPAVARQEDLSLTWGILTAVALGIAVITALLRWTDPVVRAVVNHPFRAWLASMAAIAVVVAPSVAGLTTDLVLSREAVHMSALPVLVAGVLAVLVVAAWNLRPSELVEDPVVPPLPAAGAGAGGRRRQPTKGRGAAIVVALSTPVATVALVAVSWWAATR
ncbi:hypothetical protein DNL40_08835 [Xylanimonas oleitrophica]|uniref:Uncharacterized protein n=1 Tax=Xylanimonas oleitrophica TaxID=2607479 RepID=A0A2W5YF34_9MICO|nr:hypothetical protein [Xylanimonas oleitrophica]PZR53101.1 hypothetical protein DNL40_08835 [Xylanimonas oleitrophica]